jgi:hypothetical protein
MTNYGGGGAAKTVRAARPWGGRSPSNINRLEPEGDQLIL